MLIHSGGCLFKMKIPLICLLFDMVLLLDATLDSITPYLLNIALLTQIDLQTVGAKAQKTELFILN